MLKQIKFWVMKHFYFVRLVNVGLKINNGRYFVFRDEDEKFVQWVADRSEKNTQPLIVSLITAAKEEMKARERMKSRLTEKEIENA